MFLGPHRLADYDDGRSPPASRLRPSLAPCSGRQGQALSGALARVLDRPCARRQFRCAGRDEETAAQPNKATGQPGLRGPSQGSWWMKGSPRGRAFPFPFPRAVERWGTANGNGAPISGL